MSDGTQDAPDTAASAQVTDHPFIQSSRNPYLCGRCSLGEAAHASPSPDDKRSRAKDDTPTPLPVAEIDKSEMEEHVIGGEQWCGVAGPAPELFCELVFDHEGLHAGRTPHSDDPIRWGNPTPDPTPEPDDPIGGGRIQELLQDPATREAFHHMTSGVDLETGEKIPQATDQVSKVWGAGTRGQVLVEGERMDQHGPPVPNMERVARGWSIISEANIRPQHVPLMMVWFKLVRETQGHLDDNLTDIEGYTEIMRQVVKELGE